MQESLASILTPMCEPMLGTGSDRDANMAMLVSAAYLFFATIEVACMVTIIIYAWKWAENQ